MSLINRNINLMLVATTALMTLGACQREEAVSFSQDVKPILDKYCIECHLPGGEGVTASGFSMASHEGVMRGTRHGPMVIAGDSEGSNMIVLMEGRADPSISMPHGQDVRASRQEIETIRRWIDQGAKNN